MKPNIFFIMIISCLYCVRSLSHASHSFCSININVMATKSNEDDLEAAMVVVAMGDN